MINFLSDLKNMFWYEYLIIISILIAFGFLIGLGFNLALMIG